MKAYRYRDKFQLVPIFYMPTAPISIYASHIPCILEYQVEDIEEKLPTESMFREKGLSEGKYPIKDDLYFWFQVGGNLFKLAKVGSS